MASVDWMLNRGKANIEISRVVQGMDQKTKITSHTLASTRAGLYGRCLRKDSAIRRVEEVDCR